MLEASQLDDDLDLDECTGWHGRDRALVLGTEQLGNLKRTCNYD